MYLDLQLNKEVYTFNDHFQLTLRINNTGSAFFAEQYVFLQIGDAYWFWPEWTPEVTRKLMIYDYGAVDNTILDFVWPPVNATGSDYRFHAALCKPGSFDLVSNIDSVSFSFE